VLYCCSLIGHASLNYSFSRTASVSESFMHLMTRYFSSLFNLKFTSDMMVIVHYLGFSKKRSVNCGCRCFDGSYQVMCVCSLFTS
jgi:hypothetical protein